jgi:hypothetical protein
MGSKFTRPLWVILHDVVGHPVCGVLWVLGLRRLGDWLHDVTLPPLSEADEQWDAQWSRKYGESR